MAGFRNAYYDAIWTDERHAAPIVRAVVRRWLAKLDTAEIARQTGFAESLVSNVIARFQDRRYAALAAQAQAAQA